MIWIDDIKSRYLEQEIYADISYNIDTVILDNSLTDTESEACSLAAAVTIGHYGLWNHIYKNYSTEIEHRQAALAAAQAMVAFAQHEFIKTPIGVAYAQSKIRNRALSEYSKIPIQQYDLYRLAVVLTEQNTDAASMLGKICMNSGYTNLNIADVNRIVSVIRILGKILPNTIE